MPYLSYTTIDFSGAASPQYAAVTGVDAAGEVVGYEGDSSVGNTGDVGFVYEYGVVTTLETPNSRVAGITAAGEILETYGAGNQNAAFVIGAGETLGDTLAVFVPYSASTSVVGVNDDGVTYGQYEDDLSDVVHGFIQKGNAFTATVTVDVAGFSAPVVSGVNASGEFVGEALNSSGVEYGFVDIGGAMTTFDAAPSSKENTQIFGVSDAGEVLGDWIDDDSDSHAFLYQNGVITPIDIAGAVSVLPTAINESGVVTGSYTDSAGDTYGFVDENGEIETVAVPGASSTIVNGVNAQGVIYGSYFDSAGQQAFYGRLGPALAITSANDVGVATLDLAGTIDADDAGLTIAIDNSDSQIGTVVANASGDWSTSLSLPLSGVYALTAQAVDSFGNVGVSNTIYDLVDAQTMIDGGGAYVIFSGSGDSVAFDVDGGWDTVKGSNGTIAETGAQVSIVGGGNTIDFDGGIWTIASLYGTNNDWDTVDGDDGSIALNGAQASVVGGDDTIDFDAGSWNTASLYDTKSLRDAIVGDDGWIALNGAQAAVVGGGDTMYFASGGANAVNLYNTYGNWDAVYGNGGLVEIADDTQVSVVGGGDTIDFDDGLWNMVSIYDSTNAIDTVNGDNGLIALNSASASLIGSSDTIYMNGTSTVDITGYLEGLRFAAQMGQATVTGFGSTDVIHLSASDWSSFAALQSSGDLQQSGANAVITLNAANSITLVDTSVAGLNPSEFVFS